MPRANRERCRVLFQGIEESVSNDIALWRIWGVRRWVGVALGFSSAFVHGVATGQTEVTAVAEGASSRRRDPVELQWIRLEGAEQCPPKSAFEAALEKRVPGATFSARGSRVLTVTLSNEKGPFRAVLSLNDRASDAVESKQELFSYSSVCDEVFAATVLSVALLLNPDEMDATGEETLEESDTGFFDPPSSDVGLGAPMDESKDAVPSESEAAYEIPVAPRPWVRKDGAVTTSLLVGIEQLPQAAAGVSVRTDWPVQRSWLLWLSADWLQTSPAPAVAQGVTINQVSGWLGGAWVPYDDERLEVHLLGGLGVRQLTATLTASEPQYHLALQLGVGVVVQLTRSLALDGRAAAVVPFRGAPLGAWIQPAVGGQLQLGVTVVIPSPSAPN